MVDEDHKGVTVGKHLDKLGSFENFTAPWETEAGSDAEIDKPKLKRLIFNLKSGEAKALDAKEEQADELTEATKALEKAKSDLAGANGEEAQKTIDKLQKKVDDLKADIKKRDDEKEASDLRAEVIGDLDPKYAKYVVGSTQEELEKSLEQVRKDFNLGEETDEEREAREEREERDAQTGRTQPRPATRRLTNPADDNTGKGGDSEVDFNKVADQIIGQGRIFG